MIYMATARVHVGDRIFCCVTLDESMDVAVLVAIREVRSQHDDEISLSVRRVSRLGVGDLLRGLTTTLETKNEQA